MLNDMHLDSLIELTEITIKQKDKREFNEIVNLISKIDEGLAKSYLENSPI
jgi:hypothetical protein